MARQSEHGIFPSAKLQIVLPDQRMGNQFRFEAEARIFGFSAMSLGNCLCRQDINQSRSGVEIWIYDCGRPCCVDIDGIRTNLELDRVTRNRLLRHNVAARTEICRPITAAAEAHFDDQLLGLVAAVMIRALKPGAN